MTRLLAAILLLPACAPAQEQWDARLAKIDGEVTVFTAEDPDGAPAEADMPLQAGDRLETAAGSSAEVSYDGEGVVFVEERSKLEIAALDKGDATLSLSLGALVAKLQTLTSGRRMRVRTPTAVAAVRGTEFGVEVEGGQTHVGVFDEGQVAVADLQGNEELLAANQETLVRSGARPVRAAALKRFARRRALIARVRARQAGLRKAWRSLPPEKRQELRQRRLKRMRERRARLRQHLERRRERIERGGRRLDRRRDRRRNP